MFRSLSHTTVGQVGLWPKLGRQFSTSYLRFAPKTELGQQRDKVWTLPNALTISRLVAAPAVGYLILHNQTTAALGVFTYCCATDFLDGWIARKWNQKSVVGSIIDPAADKLLMVTLASCMVAAGQIPWWCGSIILGRDFYLGLSAFYLRYISLPPPKTFTRYWDMSIPSVQVYPSQLSKWNTLFQMVYLGLAVAAPVFTLPATAMNTFAGLVTTTTALSWIDYIVNRPFEFIKGPTDKKQ